ncbi:hypothetical protein [Luteitalea pratensis]|uniref:hypothetical protein n=1 Tax=Luteitalea pratensis TaxID=1855912 RepID=UPI000D7315C8|nr:hypothetical protein [Luteitalea pratensis]
MFTFTVTVSIESTAVGLVAPGDRRLNAQVPGAQREHRVDGIVAAVADRFVHTTIVKSGRTASTSLPAFCGDVFE